MDIEVKELKERMDKKEALNIIDVREIWEYEEANIGAKNIPLATLPNHLSEFEDWKSKEVIIHCKSGRRSAQAQQFMKQNGFENVRNLTGGIDAYLADLPD